MFFMYFHNFICQILFFFSIFSLSLTLHFILWSLNSCILFFLSFFLSFTRIFWKGFDRFQFATYPLGRCYHLESHELSDVPIQSKIFLSFTAGIVNGFLVLAFFFFLTVYYISTFFSFQFFLSFFWTNSLLWGFFAWLVPLHIHLM